MKNLIKEVLPPILLKGINKIRFRPSFRLMTDADAESLRRKDAFASEAWLTHTRTKLSKPNNYRQGYMTPHRFVLSMIAGMFSSRAKIVDWGGGMGELYDAVTSHIQDKRNVDYIVVDNSELSSKGVSQRKEIKFVDYGRINLNLVSNADLLFLSGVLQYVDDWKSLLSTISKLTPEYFVICRHLSCDKSEAPIKAVQRITTPAGYAGEAAITFVNRNSISNELERMGYRLLSSMVTDSPVIFGEALDKKLDITESVLIYRRMDNYGTDRFSLPARSLHSRDRSNAIPSGLTPLSETR